VKKLLPMLIIVLLTFTLGCEKSPTESETPTTGPLSLQSSGTSAELNGVHFIDAMNGWIAGAEATVLKTTDGGAHWTAVQVDSSAHFSDVWFTDVNNGWLVAGNGKRYHTSDGGQTWTAHHGPSSFVYFKLCFPTVTSGVAVGTSFYQPAGALVSMTSNGGSFWADHAFIHPEDTSMTGDVYLRELNDVSFPAATIGYVAGSGGFFMKTTDSGANWTDMSDKDEIGSARAVCFTDVNTGYLLTDLGAIRKTNDGGTSWATQITVNHTLNALAFADAQNGLAVGIDNYVMHTSDAGNNWTHLDAGISTGIYFKDVAMISNSEAWVVGTNGTILHYKN
jgi:photosystem II stability/assembly factor-like uncharacterized protein